VIDAGGTVIHTELVDDTSHEPNYDAAIAAL
jgi:peroxiredoxin